MTSRGRRLILAALPVGIALAVIVVPSAPGPAATGPLPTGDRSAGESPGSRSFAVPATPPVQGETISADVVVYGATPSGILAAISAARVGASVALVTPDAQVGGMMTSGLSHPDLGRQELIGGITRDVFQRIVKLESRRDPPAAGWNYEPHVAQAVFDQLLREAHVIVRLGLRLDRTSAPERQGNRIVAIRMTDGTLLRGTVFIDASYEGDLMAAAGVPFAIGREARAATGESLAGVYINGTSRPSSTLVSGLDGSGNPLPGADRVDVVSGSADGLVQSATFRLCVTDDPANRLPFAEPAGYDRATYALVGRAIAKAREQTGAEPALASFLSFARLPDRKADLNNSGLYSTNLVGGAAGWPEADDARRQVIWEQHRAWVAGLLWYLETDPDVPLTFRDQLARWGLCADEFRATGGWPPELYVREARRMVGSVVLSQRDIQTDVTKPDPIALGVYRIDAHPARRILGSDGLVRGDGQLSGVTAPYQIPYAAIVPPPGSVDNLLVSVTVSATHVAWTSIRMEPTLMQIGEAAGVAAALAVRERVGVREVGYDEIRTILLERGGILSVPRGVAPAMRRHAIRQ